MKYDFTAGDNNDGITILDLVENKYCFMNIDTKRRNSYDVRMLPMLKPATAREYVAAYYGETPATTNPYKFGDHNRKKVTMSKEDQQKVVDEFIKGNEEASAPFAEFGLLTKDEIKVMFAKPKPDGAVLIPKKKGEKITLMVPNKR